MKINYNMSAKITNAQLLRTESKLSDSMERLSTGLKINSAKDDPAGMAISNKMQSQIDCLDQASQNASNGTSVIQIADSSLNEVTSMIQRMRELAVQAASDTNTDSDRQAIQDEITSLRSEIDRVSKDTEYNTKTLLDGSLDQRVYADHISRVAISDYVPSGIYQVNVAAAATQAQLSTTASSSTGSIPAGKVTVNGTEVSIEAGESATTVFQKLRDAAEKGNATLTTTSGSAFTYGDSLELASNTYGSSASLSLSCNDASLATFLGIPSTATATGTDMAITLNTTTAQTNFSAQATAVATGNRVAITDANGFTMNFSVDPGYTGNVDIEVADFGAMTLQIGANENQTMDVRIPGVTSDSLYLDNIDVTQNNGGSSAISVLDEALSTVTAVRSKLGAYQNRLDHAINSLEDTNENMTSALSNIEDVDMASEMSEYTKYNVLNQAGVSVLAQANDLPQTVLQLLQR